jgi:hypothetical protein
VVDVHGREGPLILLVSDLLPENRDQLLGAVPTLSASGVDVAVLGAPPAERARTQHILADLAAFGRRVYVPQPMNAGHWHDEMQCHEHDKYFGVVRISGPGGENFLAGLVAGYLRLIDHVDRYGTDLSAKQWDDLLDLPYQVFGYASATPTAAPGVKSRPRALLVEHASALDRWRVGHQLFFTVIQTLTVAVLCAMRAAQDDDEDAVFDALTLASGCASAAAASLTLTSEFSPAEYAEGVRPTMLPPHVSPGFSGFQTRDHHRLVAVFHRLHEVRSQLAAFGEPYTCFVTAIEGMYFAHAGVCAHFGGTTGVSLRMQALSHQHPTMSGVEEALRISHGRIGLIEPPGQNPGPG